MPLALAVAQALHSNDAARAEAQTASGSLELHPPPDGRGLGMIGEDD